MAIRGHIINVTRVPVTSPIVLWTNLTIWVQHLSIPNLSQVKHHHIWMWWWSFGASTVLDLRSWGGKKKKKNVSHDLKKTLFYSLLHKVEHNLWNEHHPIDKDLKLTINYWKNYTCRINRQKKDLKHCVKYIKIHSGLSPHNMHQLMKTSSSDALGESDKILVDHSHHPWSAFK